MYLGVHNNFFYIIQYTFTIRPYYSHPRANNFTFVVKGLMDIIQMHLVFFPNCVEVKKKIFVSFVINFRFFYYSYHRDTKKRNNWVLWLLRSQKLLKNVARRTLHDAHRTTHTTRRRTKTNCLGAIILA